MPGGFGPRRFSELNLSDDFFDSLKVDYPEFEDWFLRKSACGAEALTAEGEGGGIGAFVYLKQEDEPIELSDRIIPARPRLKIGTLKVATEAQGERLGEGAIGLALWQWRDTGFDEVYVTVFEKHAPLVGMLGRFGFVRVGYKANGEAVYLKDKRALDCSDPHLCFPFVNPGFATANLLVVEDKYHDELFPYSELAHELQDEFRSSAANGITKVYVGASQVATRPGNPILIYRKYTGDQGRPGYKSVVTSYCVVTNVVQFKSAGSEMKSFNEFRNFIKNKSVFTDQELQQWYRKSNLTVVEMVYLGYFGAGHNVNYMWLKDNGYWDGNAYPHQFEYTKAQFLEILTKGGVQLEDVVVD